MTTRIEELTDDQIALLELINKAREEAIAATLRTGINGPDPAYAAGAAYGTNQD